MKLGIFKKIFEYVPFRERLIPHWLRSLLLNRRPDLLSLFPRTTFVYTRYDQDISIEISSSNLSRKLARHVYEADTLAFVEKFLARDFICFDIGANVGGVALLLANRLEKMGGNGRVYAFEPAPSNLVALYRNIQLNPRLSGRICVFNTGVGKKKNEIVLYEDPTNLGNYSSTRDKAWKDPVSCNMPVIDLDSLFQDYPLPKLDLMKIDVEGMEPDVIDGAWGLIKRYEPILILETLLSSSEAQSMYAKLLAQNYAPFAWHNDRGIIPEKFERPGKNTAFVPRRALQQLSSN